MKTIKILLFIFTVSLFTSLPYSAANAARDCSNPEGFHQKLMCGKLGVKMPKTTGGTSASNVAEGAKDKAGSVVNFLKNAFKGKKVEE